MIRRSALAVACIAGSAWLFGGCGGDSFEQPPATPVGDAGTDTPQPDTGTGDVAQPDVSPDQVGDVAPDLETGPPDSPPEAGLLPNGEACLQGGECVSGVCADELCCNVACDGCSACDLAGHEGTCTPVASGENPEDVCGTTGVPCAGKCDGAGACAYPADTTSCGASSCSGTLDSSIHPTCDGAGACVDVAVGCGNYVCAPATGDCLASCTPGSSECAPGAWCGAQSECLSKSANGETCGGNAECASDHCVDGVCCDTACDGTCEACNVTSAAGTCTPVPIGNDPDGECAGSVAACAGACDGNGACAWPGDTMQCGAPVCSAGTAQSHQYRCDGQGACLDTPKACDPFLCDAATSACKTSCTADQDCISSDYCQQPQCVLKKSDGQLCGSPNQCQSGYCETSQGGATCCNQACPAPLDCSAGACLCAGVTCGSGHACVLWYPDVDQDGYGDGSQPKSGCDNLAPKDGNGKAYVLEHTDCYDGNPDAHPGQTAYFFLDRGDGSFDYDCNDVYDKQYRDGLGSIVICQDCKTPTTCNACGTNNVYFTYGFSCNPSPTCGPSYSRAFKGTQPCGTKGTLFSCHNVVLQCSSTVDSTAQIEQRCR